MIKTESGTKLPISYKSGRYEDWIKGRGRGREIRIGEREKEGNKAYQHRPGGSSGGATGGPGGKRWKHSSTKEAKPLDKLAVDYERKVRILKKKGAAAAGGDDADTGGRARGTGGRGRGGKTPGTMGGRWKGKTPGRVKTELKSVQQIRKQRGVLEKKREKNARNSRGGKGKGRR